MDAHYLQAVPPHCTYGPLGCLSHPHGQLWHPSVPWCVRGRRVVAAVVQVYERRAAAPLDSGGGALGKWLWQRESRRMASTAAQLRRAAGL